jgi:hypothetical protein
MTPRHQKIIFFGPNRQQMSNGIQYRPLRMTYMYIKDSTAVTLGASVASINQHVCFMFQTIYNPTLYSDLYGIDVVGKV